MPALCLFCPHCEEPVGAAGAVSRTPLRYRKGFIAVWAVAGGVLFVLHLVKDVVLPAVEGAVNVGALDALLVGVVFALYMGGTWRDRFQAPRKPPPLLVAALAVFGMVYVLFFALGLVFGAMCLLGGR
jgi:hypothetical protein